MGNQEQTPSLQEPQTNVEVNRLGTQDIKKIEKIERKLEGWKRYLAYAYIIICLMDFAVMPMVFELNRPSFTELAKVISDLSPEAQLMALNKTAWQPITLSYSGMFHFVIGAILTGVAVFNNKFSSSQLPKN